MKIPTTRTSLIFFLCILPTIAYGGFLDELLPSWPVDNVGESVPDDLIKAWGGGVGDKIMGHRCPSISHEFSAFPSKAPAEKKKQEDDGSYDERTLTPFVTTAIKRPTMGCFVPAGIKLDAER
jgi:hypothetical protein